MSFGKGLRLTKGTDAGVSARLRLFDFSAIIFS